MVKLKNIQVIRGIAALFVCFFHSKYLVDIDNEDQVIEHIRRTIGIPLFYIISGFVLVFITPMTLGNPWKAAKVFLIKRCIRIVPLFYFCIGLYLLVCHKDIINFFTSHLGSLLKTVFFIPQFNAPEGPAFGFSFFYVSWSLNYEILFYLVFAISMLFSKFRYHFIFIYYFVCIVLMPLIFKGYVSTSPAVNYDFSPKFLDFLANPIQLCFVSGIAFGIFVAKYYNRIMKASPVLITVIYLAAVIAYFAYGSKLIGDFFGSDLIMCSLLVYMMIIADFKLKIPFPRFLLYLGNISYSIYLLHPIIFIYLVGLVNKLGLTKLESSWYLAAIGIVIVILVSAIVHELFEKKCIAYFRKRLLDKSETREPRTVGVEADEKKLSMTSN